VRIDGIANAEIIEAGPRSPRADDPGQHVAEAVINGRLAALLVARSPHELTLTHGG
jgi:hypothetical protein